MATNNDLIITATEAASPIGDLDAGIYPATIIALEPVEGDFGAQVRFTLCLADEVDSEGNPLEVYAWSSWKLNPKTKLWLWIVSLTGRAPVVGQPYKLATLLGRDCRVSVERVLDKDGVTMRPRVAALLGPARAKPDVGDRAAGSVKAALDALAAQEAENPAPGRPDPPYAGVFEGVGTSRTAAEQAEIDAEVSAILDGPPTENPPVPAAPEGPAAPTH
jgi:hypothetical protein